MERPLISVIMSTYNENVDELKLSIYSILEQTYSNIEFLIVDDNPERKSLNSFLREISDNRVKIIANDHNIGLVASLNKALKMAKGTIIARMDADDCALRDRLQKQYVYMLENNLDFLGTDIQLIDENNNIIRERMHFPSTEKKIRTHIKYGNCVAHPTWMVKKAVYDELDGYRDIPSCEDYDFVLRLLSKKKFRCGNAPFIGLKYRVRQSGISMSNSSSQYLLRKYLAEKREHIDSLTERNIDDYKNSSEFAIKLSSYNCYLCDKKLLKKKPWIICCILFNKFLYDNILERVHLYLRERDYEQRIS